VSAAVCRYKPLAGMTSEMMVWFFNNDHKNITYTAAVGSKRTAPM
jgi:hypothetical protein